MACDPLGLSIKYTDFGGDYGLDYIACIESECTSSVRIFASPLRYYVRRVAEGTKVCTQLTFPHSRKWGIGQLPRGMQAELLREIHWIKAG